ncbi:MAG: NAD-dependent epimerase/dehydratase family protein [Bryobacterales bacterium]|nr:NAD-dependent epimerase/dehydratase family protein [Bryobacterales bacterium]
MSHALVTGGAGFIGSHLVDRLLAEGWKVTAVDSFDPSCYPRETKEANLAGCRARGWFRLIEADLRDAAALQSGLDGGYDVIVHLAAREGFSRSLAEPGVFQEVNVCGTQNLLECARTWGVKQFVFVSSGSVYGLNPRLPWREDDTELRPVSLVASTKMSGEALGHVYSHLYNIRFVALRLFPVYGPRQRPDQAVYGFAQAMLEGRPVEICGDGAARSDFTFVGDAVDGIRAAMDYRDLSHEVINLGSGRSTGLCEVVQALEGALGVAARIESKRGRACGLPQACGDIRKAQRLLGYHPRTTLQEGMYEFAAWLTGVSARSLLALHEALAQAALPGGLPAGARAPVRSVAPTPEY